MNKFNKIFLSLLTIVCLSGGTLVLVSTYVFKEFTVVGLSMEPNYSNNEVVRCNVLDKTVRRGDVVVSTVQDGDSQKTVIKRVIGLPNDKIQIDVNGNVFVNGTAIVESYISPIEAKYSYRAGSQGCQTAILIPDRNIFLLGDNRKVSRDSRDVGPVSLDNVVGTVVTR